MPGPILGAVKRQIAAAVTAAVLLAILTALAFIALGAFAFAIHHHFRPEFGAEVAWWISGGIFLILAILIGAVLYWRLRGRSGHLHRAETDAGPEAALQLAALLRDELPRNAVPATVLALVAGIAVGLNPQALRVLMDSLSRKRESS